MYCINCGNIQSEKSEFCENCGTPIASMRQNGSASITQPNSYTSWEYTRTTVKSDLSQVTTDCYESLGFELTGSKTENARALTTLSFRRSRKLKGKAQLVKLQRTIDDLIANITRMEAEKTSKATIRALVLGVISALILGIGMCCTMVWTELMAIGVVVGVLGIAGCIGAWLLYRSTIASESQRIAPSIEAAYDRLASACEEAQAALRSQETNS